MFRSIRPSRPATTHVKRLDSPEDILSAEITLESRLRAGDYVLCVAGDVIPRDGYLVSRHGQPHAGNVGPRVTAGVIVRADYVVICIAPAADER